MRAQQPNGTGGTSWAQLQRVLMFGLLQPLGGVLPRWPPPPPGMPAEQGWALLAGCGALTKAPWAVRLYFSK